MDIDLVRWQDQNQVGPFFNQEGAQALYQGAQYAWQNREYIRRGVEGAKDYMRRVKMRRPRPSGPSERPSTNPDLGQSVGRLWECTTGPRKYKKLKLAPAVKELLVRNEFVFQSLKWSALTADYRTGGSMQLAARYTEGTSATYPRSVQFPVYIFRLSTPGNGYQYTFSAATQVKASPYVCYRLIGRQDYENEPWRYSWSRFLADVPISNNLPDASMGYTATNLDHAAAVSYESIHDAQKICHEMSEIQILFTAPTASPMDVGTAVIDFTDDKWAPPDEFVNYTASPATIEVVQPNIDDISIADSHTLADRLSPWLAGSLSHPCFQPIYSKGVTSSKFWNETSKFGVTLTARNTTNADGNAVQYKHRQFFRPNRWFNTNCEPERTAPIDAPNEVGMNQQRVTTHGGIFPKTTEQRWLMVYGFTRAPILAQGVEPAITANGSFDISIRSRFASAKVQ